MGLRGFAFLALCFTASGAVSGNVLMEREAALALSRTVDTGDTRLQLLDLAVAGNATDVLTLLQESAQRRDWPEPARDRLLYDFAQSLRSLPRAAVPAEVLTWLGAYQPLTLVPHEDHVTASVPLYNVRGVAAGVENDWRRQDALLEGLALIASHPRSLVDAWLLDDHPASRLGYLQAIEQAQAGQLQELGKHARRRLDAHPDLTPLAGQAALLGGDVESLGEVFALGAGASLAPLMRRSAAQLAPEASAALLESTLAMASGTNAALAIAELSAAAAGIPHTQDLLIDRLGDQQLGTTAALALARVASDQSLQRLRSMAEEGGGTSAQHARLALELRGSAPKEPQ